MPEQGRYEKIPRPESIEKFLQYLSGSSAVDDLVRESNQIVRVQRKKHSSLRVFMTNIYVVGLADVYEILSGDDQLNAIVTMSGWNGYTTEAKKQCKEVGVGLFKFGEFLGAVYYGGSEYLDYIPPDERERRETRSS